MPTTITVITGTGSASYTVSTGARGPAASAASHTYAGADPNGNVTATFLGQWCKATTAWWQWNGTVWIPRFTLSGQQITRNDTDDAYFVLGVDGDGAPTTTPFP